MRPRVEPFRAAFVLAALTAIRAVVPGTDDPSLHADELIFGFLVVQLFGFLTVALPRWIGRPLNPPALVWTVLAGHAVAFAWGWHDLAAGAALRSVVGLAGVAMLVANVPPDRWRPVLPTLLLVGLHAGLGAAATLLDWPGATMAGFAVIVFICLELSDRIGAALIATARQRNGHTALPNTSDGLALIRRLAAGVALVLWATGVNAAVPALVAGLMGLVWLWRLRAWEIGHHAGVTILVVGMAWKRLAFLLLAVDEFGIVPVPPLAVIHAFAVGGLATLAIAIATSITRKRDKRSFTPSRLANVIYAAITLAALARLGAALFPDGHDRLLAIAQWGWVAAFAGYVAFTLRGVRGRAPALA